ncbi:E3 ubiquitin-protein ligase BRE1 [Nosema bombycis CQ1]|uniref:E3 ubiquitin protein ligase n=1 Tax=Nosema bombycis (strain CQ1 / CVCC 102059) TaxID=578461 RepID=R0MB13_NOSB1|nr:E3 ubiquitin-protein ligase BRE1 [Nosema bombycis CQ1]|eukprot:EOB11230.1 E3 ubiquitin-protein ligase BRE1 [Nosema bombycis CQ1]
MIKYEETKSKYDSCYSQLKNSLINLEEIRKFHMSRDVIKIKRMTNLNKEMKGMEYVIKDLENQIYGIQREYLNLCEYMGMYLERDVKRKEGGSKVGVNSKVRDSIDLTTTPNNNTPTPPTDSFYENEISNLLQVCDSLTEQNNLLEGQRDDLQSQIDFLKRRNLSLEKDFEMIRLKDSSSFEYIQTYLIKINELSDSIQEICKKLENSNLERNKLTKLNIERISLIEKYKEDLRNKEIEFNIVKNNYNEILEDLKNKKNEEDKKGDTPLILCNLCESKPKNVALISCMHTFCDECIESRIKFRNRRCPTCGLVFGSNDVKKIYL